MKCAALLVHGVTAVVVVDIGTLAPPRIVHVQWWPTDQIGARQIRDLLCRLDVSRVAVDPEGVSGDAAKLLVATRDAIEGADMTVEVVAHAERQRARARLREALPDWPLKTGNYELQAAHLAVAAFMPQEAPASLEQALATSVHGVASASGGGGGGGSSTTRHDGVVASGSGHCGLGVASADASATPANAPIGRVRIAIDPGVAPVGLGRRSRGGTGVVVTAGDIAPLQVLYRTLIPTGRRVKLPRPLKRGKRVYDEATVLEWSDIEAIATQVAAIAIEYGATSAIIERSTFVFGRATVDVVRAAEVGAVVAERLRAHGIQVVRESVATVRARVTKDTPKKKNESWDVAIARTVAAGFSNWPTTGTTVDERDAAALALFDALPAPPPVVHVTRTRLKAKDARSRAGRRRPAQEEARAASIAARAIAGCTCKIGGRHANGCPLQDNNKKGGRPRKVV